MTTLLGATTAYGVRSHLNKTWKNWTHRENSNATVLRSNVFNYLAMMTLGTIKGQQNNAVSGAVLMGMSSLFQSVGAQPFCPQLAGSYDTPDVATDVAVSGNYAYIADFNSGLQIIDVSNVSNPTLAGFYDTPGQAMAVIIFGNYAYVADRFSDLQIIDVSNVTNPTLAGFYDTPGYAFGIAVSDNYAYVADRDSGLQIIDISNVANPTLAGFYDTPDLAFDVAVSGNYAYVADFNSGLQIIDVSNAANPTLAGFYDPSDEAYSVAVSGNYAYVADRNSGLQIIDVNNIANPTLAGSYDTSGQAYGVAVSGNYAYVANLNSGLLQIIDVSNITNPTLAGFYDTSGLAYNVAVSGNYAYVADGSSGLQIIDISLFCSSTATTITTSSITSSLPSTSLQSSTRPTTTSFFSSTSNQPSSSISLNSSSSRNTRFNTSILSSITTSSDLNTISTTMNPTSMSAMFSTTTKETVSEGSSYGWIIGVVGGLLCLGLTGGAVYILQKRKRTSDVTVETEEMMVEPTPKDHSSFKLKPVVERSHKKIGGTYYQLSTIVRQEAEEIYENTGHIIVFPEGKKKFKYVIGKGNFGAIKIAQRIEDHEYVASKKVKGEKNMKVSEEEANMQQEAAGLNVLPIYNTIELEEALYHFMPLAGYGSGREIQSHLSALNNPNLATEIIKFVTKDVLTGVKTIHGKGIYHLDIKPENVVFTKDGTAYITDFGCAKKTKDRQMPWDTIGDNRYFSPERLQACKEQSTFDAEKADVWAAGMMLLQMVKNLSPLQLFDMPDNFSQRVQECTQDYFMEKLNQFEELQKPEEREIWWVIKGLLDPNAETRITAEKALQASCFIGLKKKTQAHVFEDLQAEKLMQEAGIDRDELDLKDYNFVSQVVAEREEEKAFYNTQEHQQYYTIKHDYQLTPNVDYQN